MLLHTENIIVIFKIFIYQHRCCREMIKVSKTGFPNVSTLLRRADMLPYFMSEERGCGFLRKQQIRVLDDRIM